MNGCSRRAALGAVAAAWLAAGCASLSPDERIALAGHPPLPGRVLLEHPPFHPQLEFQCGPAALATVLGASGVAVAPERLAEDVFLPARRGSLQVEMLAGSRRHGRVATRIDPSLAALLRELAAGEPVVLLQNLGLGWAPLWHYAVAVGYDLPASDLLLRSGTSRLLRMQLATFDRTWARGGRWAFMATTPGRFPVSADEPGVVEAMVGFERVALPAEAVLGYSEGLARWPGSLALGLGLGNSLHASGNLRGAAAAFGDVVRRHPQSPPGWINLALTWRSLGNLEEARPAAVMAVQVARSGAEGASRWTADAEAALRQVEMAAASPRP